MLQTSSSTNDFLKKIEGINPFDGEVIVRCHEIWGKGFPDVPFINAHASDAVFRAIQEVKQGRCRVVGIAMRAEKGLGKTHIISRIRHRLQNMGGSLFVYMGEYPNLNKPALDFLKNLAFSFKQEGRNGVLQWQELATALVNDVTGNRYEPHQLVNQTTDALVSNPETIDDLTQQVLEAKPEIENPDLIQAILWTLSRKEVSYAVRWLSGNSLSQSKANKLNLPNSTEEEREAEAFDTICQILDLTGNYTVPVICFDDIDKAQNCDDAGLHISQVVASFIKDVYNKARRAVLLTTMYPATWSQHIRALPHAEAVVDRVGQRIIDLFPINSDDVVKLVVQYLNETYTELGITPPHPVYPFNEQELRQIGKQKPTARDVLQWCEKNWSLPAVVIDPVESAFKKELEGLIDEDLLEDSAAIARALIFCFNRLIGKILEGTEIQSIQSPVIPASRYIDFKIIGKANGNTEKIGVIVVQESSGVGIQARLKHIIDYGRYDLTRGCLVRSKKIPANAQRAREHLQKLLDEQQGEWVALHAEELKPLMAITSVFDSRSDYELSEEAIFEYIAKQEIAAKNPLLLEILSAPSGQEPEDTVDEEAEEQEPATAVPQLTDTSKPEIAAVDGDRPQLKGLVGNYTGKTIKAFMFQGNRHPVRSWKGFLVAATKTLLDDQKGNLEKVFELKGRSRVYFTRDRSELRSSCLIAGTDVYMEVGFSANQSIKLVRDLMVLFSYPEDSIQLEVEK